MANFDSAHLYVQWGGKLPGSEQWSCGVRLRKKTPGTPNSGAGLIAGMAATIQSYHQRATTGIHPTAQLSFLKVNAIGVDGRYIGAGTNQVVFADLVGGGENINPFPNQICAVVTLRTGFTRGPAHSGRFYLPLPSVTIQSDGRVNAGWADGVSDSTDTFISDLNGQDADYEVAIFSRKSGQAGNRRVTGNQVGRVLDTQRRRRRSLVEDYQ